MHALIRGSDRGDIKYIAPESKIGNKVTSFPGWCCSNLTLARPYQFVILNPNNFACPVIAMFDLDRTPFNRVSDEVKMDIEMVV
jgi:hypothetical protein